MIEHGQKPENRLRRLLRRGVMLLGVGVFVLSLVACVQQQRNSVETVMQPAPENSLRLASYNVHYIILSKASGAWSVGDWEARKAPMDQAFKTVDADVMAFQEMESFAHSWGERTAPIDQASKTVEADAMASQETESFVHGEDGSTNLTLEYLLAQNPGYKAAAVGDPRVFPSTQPIFYRADKLRVLDQGWFFFSTTPDVIYSRTFNGSYPAFASWAKFTPKAGGKPFTVFNIHFEFKSASNRRLSAALVQERMAPLLARGETVVLMGDLNERLGSSVVAGFEATGLRFAPFSGSTYHLNRGMNLFGAIDHIATSAEMVPVGAAAVLRQKFGGRWPSDHYPIYADYMLP